MGLVGSVGQLIEKESQTGAGRADLVEFGQCVLVEGSDNAVGLFNAEDGGVGEFVGIGVFAEGFADFGGVALDIEEVVDDLELEPEVPGEI